MKYELCIACDHCDPADTNERQQIRCTKIESYVDRFNGCDYYENKALDEYFKKLLTVKANESEWISVKDSLPAKDGRYLTTVCNYKGEVEVFDLWYNNPYWLIDEGDDFYEFDVTHWMPLPKPPKEGVDNAEN